MFDHMELQAFNLAGYREIVVLTGAGVSVASGLQTYRGAGGLWKVANVEQNATVEALALDPMRVWSFFAELRLAVANARPNPAHQALAQAEAGLGGSSRFTVITQNVDGLHSTAGSRRVVELHGTLHRSRCTACDFVRPEVLAASTLACPACPRCSQTLRPDVVLFGEQLPVAQEWESKKVLRDCDLFIAVGTSGSVSPASNFVRSAKYAGARTVYIDPEPMVPPNPAFDETYLGKAEDLLPLVFGTAPNSDLA